MRRLFFWIAYYAFCVGLVTAYLVPVSLLSSLGCTFPSWLEAHPEREWWIVSLLALAISKLRGEVPQGRVAMLAATVGVWVLREALGPLGAPAP